MVAEVSWWCLRSAEASTPGDVHFGLRACLAAECLGSSWHLSLNPLQHVRRDLSAVKLAQRSRSSHFSLCPPPFTVVRRFRDICPCISISYRLGPDVPITTHVP